MNRPPRPGMIRRFLLAFGEFAVVLALFATAWLLAKSQDRAALEEKAA